MSPVNSIWLDGVWLFFFLSHFPHLSLLIRVFDLFTFKIIIDRIGFMSAILLLISVLCLFVCFFVTPLLSSFVLSRYFQVYHS